MPTRAKKLCAHPGCSAIVSERYCNRHKQANLKLQQERKSRFDKERGSAAARGYDRDWQHFRVWYLRRNPLCQMCEAHGTLTPATVIHHIAKLSEGGDKYDEDNLMPVCRGCHEKIHGRFG